MKSPFPRKDAIKHVSMCFPVGDRPLSIFLLAADKMKSCLSWL